MSHHPGNQNGKPAKRVLTRREFAGLMGTAAAGLMVLPAGVSAAAGERDGAFINLARIPDAVTVITETETRELRHAGRGHWEGGGIGVITAEKSHGVGIQLNTPSAAVKRVHMRWAAAVATDQKILGDQWERAYGDLHWATMEPTRTMPWYFMAFDGNHTHGYGVMTLPTAFCHWQMDAQGVHLWADVRSGGMGVQLGGRRLDVCEVVCRRGKEGEPAFAATRAFCQMMSPKPRMLSHRVYGANNWYYAYGKSSAEKILDDAHFTVSLSPDGKNRPYCVIDDGWQLAGDTEGGFWDRGNAKFPSMPELARQITKAGAKPGIWMRPLIAAKKHPKDWRMTRSSQVLDPTVPEVRAQVRADIARMREWGFDLVKHDYSTWDIMGRWGSGMKSGVTSDGWGFARRDLTTAEVVTNFYRDIREAAKGVAVLGCNTVGHLSAGLFEISRIGDDTSGREWSRTRKMGVNCLAFRAPQQGTFFAADADCMGMTSADAIPWARNRQWLDLLARSGTPVFVSVSRETVDANMEKDLRAALAISAQTMPPAEPLDWMENPTPARWKLMGREWVYDWS